MARPEVPLQSPNELVLHVREVVACSGQMWIFGNTPARVSVGVQVVGFQPYFFVDRPDQTPSMHPCVTRLTPVQKLPVVGFHGGRKRDLLQVHYSSFSQLTSVRSALARSVWSFGGSLRTPRLYHDDWSVETMLLQDCGIRLQEWITLESWVLPVRRSTVCQWEVATAWSNLRWAEAPCPVPPVLVCAVRMQTSPLTLGLTCYWMGQTSDESTSVYSGSLASVLSCFAEEVNRVDVDCFCVFGDSINPLAYTSQINLSKFLLPQHQSYGRSRVDLKRHVSKMTLVPPLQYHSLAEAAIHPQLVRSGPLQLASVGDEVRAVARLESDCQVVSEYLQLSRVCHGAITVMVEGGQQIRVWGKLQSKIGELGLVVNREQLARRPLKVKRLRQDSSFPGENSAKSKVSMGGYISPPRIGVHTLPTMVFDFASFYVSIIQSDNVCPMTLLFEGSGEEYLDRPEYTKAYVPVSDTECLVLVVAYLGRPVESVLPQTAAELCTERVRLKTAMTQLDTASFEYSWLSAQQLAYKCLQSSLFGAMGAAQSDRYLVVPAVMTVVCMIGQFMIKKVKHWLTHQMHAEVVYGDTDSLMVQCDEDRASEIQAATARMFRHPHRFVLERVLAKLILYKPKNYAALEWQDGEPRVVIKGLASQRRSSCPWVRRVVQRVVTDLLMDRTDQIAAYVDRECQGLPTLPSTDLSITCAMKADYAHDNLIQVRTAGKISRRTGQVPDERLVYVVLAGSGSLCDRGEDPQYAEKHQRPLDRLYYLENQLKPALESVLVFSVGTLRSVSVVLAKHLAFLRSSKTGVPTLMSMCKKQKTCM